MIEYFLERPALLILFALLLLGAFALWLASPLDWRNAEGSIDDDWDRDSRWRRWFSWWI